MSRRTLSELLGGAGIVVLVGYAVYSTVYWMQNPDLTQMEIFLSNYMPLVIGAVLILLGFFVEPKDR